jgi:large subunit ribosomal protein L1
MAVVVQKRSKRYVEAAKKAVPNPVPVEQAVTAVKAFNATKFDQTVELIMNLGIDPKQADQMIRGSLSLPHGVGKTKRVIAFCPDHLKEVAIGAGAIKAGGQDLVQEIEKEGFTDFDVAVATPDMMRFVGRLGKVLGPKGLMPNPKLGSVTMNIAEAVKAAKGGQVEYRVEKAGIIHSGIGKASFSPADLRANFDALVDAVVKAKPTGAKGKYLQKVALSSTMGPGVKIDPAEAASV